MKYCTRCVLPDTRPNLVLDEEGVCSACRSHARKAEVDWEHRARMFREVGAHAKTKSAVYDCLIPVSGGKDSTWQVATCLEHGLHPLAVTWRAPGRTPLGQRNLDNLVRMGVDHIDFQVNPEVERKFTLEAIRRFGAPGLPMHMAMFNITLTIAQRYAIPLVVWGENSAIEYCGDDEERMGFRMDAAWLRTYGVMHGTTARDWVGRELSEKELTPYFGPDADALAAAGIHAVFLGYYFNWDPGHTLEVARAHGFRSRDEGPKMGYYDYADIDDDFMSVHHHVKWYKFGFSRLFDNLSIEIRNGRCSRAEAVETIRKAGDQTPAEDIAKFCAFLRIGVDEFESMIEKFRNPGVWKMVNGRWTIPGFLIPDWGWR